MSKITGFPFAYGQEYEGERIRNDDLYIEFGGASSRMGEWLTTKSFKDIEDGRIDIIGLDIKNHCKKTALPLAIVVEVAGKNMQPDYEPVLEKQIHRILNRIQGAMHTGQRDMVCLRISKSAAEKGFTLRHIGVILHSKLHDDFGRILDKIQVKIYTEEEMVTEILEKVKSVYSLRDARIEGMTDETEETFYSCTICQSFVPFHVCTISPERSSPCGSYNWLDCRASYDIDPTGPNKPVEKSTPVDLRLGQWRGVNEFVKKASQGKSGSYNLYSIMNKPMPTCEWVECVSVVLPLCNGVMVVDRDYQGMTPCGMDFKTLIDNIRGELNTPGFMGHSKYNITQRKFLNAEGGIRRIVWMPRQLKTEIMDRFNIRAKEMGIPDLMKMIADESIGTSEEEIFLFLKAAKHPALSMEPIIQL
ncbi:MAG: CO dehydrogenase/CO-methylating acetyl-CoA synthase complex subunit beta [Dehalococcoidales bacterium]|nr:CO dehydrogenase/CO-methylating acetyl-CoA synthase complex subunit beta [Dehalococcoidales bacterium]